MNQHLHCVTAESVRRGHPDKFCDQLADRILDAYLAIDENARVAVEVMATEGEMMIAGEVTARDKVDMERIIDDIIREIGYTPKDLSDQSRFSVHINLSDQSPDIAQAVDHADLGAGDQGVMVGYATDETPEYMPLPVALAHSICRELDKLWQQGEFPGMGADGKAQVTMLYNGHKPVGITAVVVSFQHSRKADLDQLKEKVKQHLLDHVLPAEYMRPSTKLHINPSGRFVKGGPAADTGLTGRKLAVDLYGTSAHIGGGALSGKDGTKVDRSGAYAARWVAKCIVAAGLAKVCEVHIAYAIGRPKPVSVDVDTFGTGILPDHVIQRAVVAVFDLRPGAIIEQLGLRRPIYGKLACYGHMGRTDLALPWEDTSKSRELVTTAIKQSTALNAHLNGLKKPLS